MSVQKKNLMLRLLTIAAFVLGVLLIYNFISFYNRATTREVIAYGSLEELVEADQKLLGNGVNGIAVNYYLYFAAACLAFVLSIKFAKITGMVTTILRSVSIGIAVICSVGGMVIIKTLLTLQKLLKMVDFEHPETYHSVVEAAEEAIDHVNIEAAAVGVLLVITSVIIFFILMITAVVSLIKRPQAEGGMED